MDENQISPDVTELKAECQWLRRQIQIILALLIVVSATLTFYLVKQVRDTNAGVVSIRAAIDNYNKNEGALTDELVKRLAEYGRTHPDFNAIYMKYGFNQVTNASPVAPKK
jgi:hypothetical protein